MDDIADRHAADETGEEGCRRERQRDLLDQERDREDRAGRHRPAQGTAADGSEPDRQVGEREKRRRQVEPETPSQAQEVREGDERSCGGDTDQGPDPRAKVRGEGHDATGARDRENVPPPGRIEPEQDAGSHENNRPNWGVVREEDAEHSRRSVAREDVGADAEVLGVVLGHEPRGRHEQQNGQDDRREHDHGDDQPRFP